MAATTVTFADKTQSAAYDATKNNAADVNALKAAANNHALLIDKQAIPPIVTLTDATTITLDATTLIVGQVASATIAGNRTLTISNAVDGQVVQLRIIQDSTGGRTLAITNGRATTSVPALSLATAAGAITYVSLRYESAANKFAYTGLAY